MGKELLVWTPPPAWLVEAERAAHPQVWVDGAAIPGIFGRNVIYPDGYVPHWEEDLRNKVVADAWQTAFERGMFGG